MVSTYRPSIDKVFDNDEWSPLEQQLLQACSDGQGASFVGRPERPETPNDPARRVRASLIRYLLEGGCDSKGGQRPHPSGIMLQGAWIEGDLDCTGCNTPLDLWMHHCHVPGKVIFRDATLGGLYLEGTYVRQGLDMRRIRVEGSIYLRRSRNTSVAFGSCGPIDLVGASIHGQLDCTGGFFKGDGTFTFNCKAANFGSDVLLKQGKFRSGSLDFVRTRIAGDFDASEATICCKIDLDVSRIEDRFIWQKVRGTIPLLDLTGVQAGAMRDDIASWGRVSVYKLAGFTYHRIQSEMGIWDRTAWLEKKYERDLPPHLKHALEGGRFSLGQVYTHTFNPQPYTQLANVLIKEGNRRGADTVHMLRERRLRKTAQIRTRARFRKASYFPPYERGSKPWILLGLGSRVTWSNVFRYVFGYGYRPEWALVWMFGIWLAGFFLFWAAYASGQMVPNSDVILTSADWLAAATPYFDGCTDIRPVLAWADTPAGKDYETFSAALYALDLFLPLDALGQETTWAPSRAYGWLGTVAYWARMPIQLAGWIITAVGAAVLTGLIGRKE